MLFADDDALVILSHACKEFGLTISINKTKVKGQCIVSPPSINTDNVTLDAVDRFTYIGSTIDSNLSLDAEINISVAKAAAVMSNLNRRVCQNNNLTQMTKLHVYHACVLSTLLYSSEAWTTYTRQARKLNSFHLRCLRTRTAGRPYLRYRYTCKRDMNVAGIDTTTCEAAADDRGHWRAVVKA